VFKHRSKPPRPSVRPLRASAKQKPELPKLYMDPTDGPAQAVDDVTQPEDTDELPSSLLQSIRAPSPLVRVVRPSLFNQLRVMLSTMLARLAWRIAP
jgi:hypothetical protein